MTTRQVAHLVRVPHGDGKTRLGRLLDTNARRTHAPRTTVHGHRSLHRRRRPSAYSPAAVQFPQAVVVLLVVVQVNPVRVRCRRRRDGPPAPRCRGGGGGGGRGGRTSHGRAHWQRGGQGDGFLLRRHGRFAFGRAGGGGVGCRSTSTSTSTSSASAAEGPERVIFNGLELGRLGDEAAGGEARGTRAGAGAGAGAQCCSGGGIGGLGGCIVAGAF